MTNPEYVRLSMPERIYGKKNLLHSQLSLLSILKRHTEYERLRKEELTLKIMLRKLVDEAQQATKVLDAVLPKIVVHHTAKHDVQTDKEELRELAAEEGAIEREISEIRRRLDRLR